LLFRKAYFAVRAFSATSHSGNWTSWSPLLEVGYLFNKRGVYIAAMLNSLREQIARVASLHVASVHAKATCDKNRNRPPSVCNAIIRQHGTVPMSPPFYRLRRWFTKLLSWFYGSHAFPRGGNSLRCDIFCGWDSSKIVWLKVWRNTRIEKLEREWKRKKKGERERIGYFSNKTDTIYKHRYFLQIEIYKLKSNNLVKNFR